MSDMADEFNKILRDAAEKNNDNQPTEEDRKTYPEDLFDEFIEALRDNNLVRECRRICLDVLEIGTNLYVSEAFSLPSLYIHYDKDDGSFKLHDYSNTCELAEMCNVDDDTLFTAMKEEGLRVDDYRIYTYVNPEVVWEAVTAYGVALYKVGMLPDCTLEDNDD